MRPQRIKRNATPAARIKNYKITIMTVDTEYTSFREGMDLSDIYTNILF